MLKFWASAMGAGSVLCTLEVVPGLPVAAFDRQVELTNSTRMAIIEVYAAPVSSGRWHEDLLGTEILAPASSALVSIDDANGCRFDFMTIFDDGTTVVRRDINVCVVQKYAISSR
jgi:hypothetical protein